MGTKIAEDESTRDFPSPSVKGEFRLKSNSLRRQAENKLGTIFRQMYKGMVSDVTNHFLNDLGVLKSSKKDKGSFFYSADGNGLTVSLRYKGLLTKDATFSELQEQERKLNKVSKDIKFTFSGFGAGKFDLLVSVRIHLPGKMESLTNGTLWDKEHE